MKYVLNVSRLARRDINSTAAWYERQSEGLGAKFNGAADVAIAKLTSKPYAFACVASPIRRLMIEPFKNAVFFRIDGRVVTVIAVIDLRSDPESMRKKLRGR
jgi:plasmid stabilization system protein ParE